MDVERDTQATAPEKIAVRYGDLVGRVLHDSYRVTSRLCAGGMATIYLAEHLRLKHKQFAVKVLHHRIALLPQIFTRFRREAEIASALKHPHIVDVVDFNETDEGLPYLVMEYLEGEDLGKRLDRAGRLRPVDVAMLVDQVGGALAAAHGRGVVHRDIKPANIFLLATPDAKLHAKVLDFGISKIKDSNSVITGDHSVFGSPGYMSPEQARGAVSDVDHRTDVFALGVVCYHALSGEMPFSAPTVPGMMYRICHEDPPAIDTLTNDLSPAINRVLLKSLAKRKEDRYQRVQLFARELAGTIRRTVGAAETAPTDLQGIAGPYPEPHAAASAADALSETTAARPKRRHLAFAGWLVLVGVIVGMLVFFRSERLAEDPAPTAPPTAVTPTLPSVVSKPTAESEPQAVRTTAAAPSTTRVTLDLTPPDARVYVDGNRHKDNPLQLARSERDHRLVIRAPGYALHRQTLPASADQTLVIQLKRQRVRPEPAPTAAQPAAPTEAQPTASPSAKPSPPPTPLFDEL